MDIKANEISKIIKDQLGDYSLDVDVAEVGTVVRKKASGSPEVKSRR